MNGGNLFFRVKFPRASQPEIPSSFFSAPRAVVCYVPPNLRVKMTKGEGVSIYSSKVVYSQLRGADSEFEVEKEWKPYSFSRRAPFPQQNIIGFSLLLPFRFVIFILENPRFFIPVPIRVLMPWRQWRCEPGSLHLDPAPLWLAGKFFRNSFTILLPHNK